jgi:hypothetical protein
MLAAGQLMSPAHVRIIRLEGTCLGSNQVLVALYAGNEVNRHFLQTLLFDRVTTTVQDELPVPIGLSRYLRRAAGTASVILTDLPPAWSPLAGEAQFRFPAWIRQQVLLPADGSMLPARIIRDLKRHSGRPYSTEFSDAAADGERFYDELYAPYVLARFGPGAYVVPRERFLRRLAGNFLAKLNYEGAWIAGTILYRERDSLRLGWFGCRTCPPPRGASVVLDAACIRHARSIGLRRIVLGSSRPSLVDGSTRYKSRFGAQIVSTRLPSQSLSIGVRAWTTELATCLDDRALVRLRGATTLVHRIDRRDRECKVRLEEVHPVV